MDGLKKIPKVSRSALCCALNIGGEYLSYLDVQQFCVQSLPMVLAVVCSVIFKDHATLKSSI